MTRAMIIGAAAVGVLVTGAAVVLSGGKSRRGVPDRPSSNAPYGSQILASLNWTQKPQNDAFVFQPYSPGQNPATFGDAMGIFGKLQGLFGGGLGGGSGADRRGAAPTQNPNYPLGGPVMARSTGNAAGILGLIGNLEAPQGYDQVYGGSRIATPRPLSQMTVNEVLDWQRQSRRAGSRSTAAGRFQVIYPTLREELRKGTIHGNDLYNPPTQKKIAISLMRKRGLDRYQSGQMSDTQFANNLAKEWASLPVASGPRMGRSYYAGDGLNQALTDVSSVLSLLRGLRGA